MLRNSASDLPALYPSLDDVQAEIVHIEDLQTRPAECEIFMSDLHGEERGFLHCLKSAHGLVRTHIQESFRGGPTPVLKSEDEVNALCVLIYYPERCLFDNCLSRGVVSTNVTHSFFFPVSSNATGARQQGWYTRALELLIRLFTVLTRRLLRSAWVARCSMVLDRGPSHIRALYQTYLEDLILQSHAQGSTRFVSLIQTLFDHDMEQCKRWEASKSQLSPAALPFLAFVCHTLPLLCYDRLHVVGDIYDRGSGADVIMDALMSTFDRSSSSSFMPFDPACSVMGRPIMDFQWGNHDMMWFAAWAGSDVALCCVLRISLRYLNLRTLHEGYGVDLQELENFANKWYKDDPCQCFRPKRSNERTFTESDCALYARMQKAIAIIQFKLEEQWITRSPDAFACKHRHLLAGIHAGKTSIVLDNERFSLLDGHFPTLDVTSQETVERLTEDEARTLESLRKSFNRSERLRSHMAFLVRCGSMYAIRGDALMFHASIPMCTDGTLRDCRSILEDGLRVTLSEKSCPQLEKSPRLPQGPIRGKMYLDVIDSVIRHAWNVSERKHRCAPPVNRNDPLVVLHTELCDFLYYLWTGALSPLFGKTRMATFERYFIADPRAHREPGDPYYRHRTKKDSVSIILKDFGIHPERGFIVNGHTPVKVKKGESAVKAGGHVLVIDGGFSEAYQSETGIAGFSLVTDAAGAAIVQHRKYPGEERILSTGEDMVDVIQPIRDHTQIVKTWDPAEEKQLVQLKTKLVALRTQYEQMGTATRRMQAHL